ncbi:MAG: CRISPR system precrRNA processing endoribonuclease RAMP protein Cas6 [Candidatus Bathyarchaeia archaeon]
MVYKAFLRVAWIRVSSRSYEEILSNSKPSETFRLIFKTPTCFSALNKRYFYLFPEAKHVFGGLLKLWKLFSPIGRLDMEGEEEYTKWIASQIGVSGYELSTRYITIGRRKAIGFTGWVNFRMGDGSEWRKLTNALGRLSEYTNVGKNRTGGFGVVEFVEKAREPDLRSTYRQTATQINL